MCSKEDCKRWARLSLPSQPDPDGSIHAQIMNAVKVEKFEYYIHLLEFELEVILSRI